MGFKCNNLQQEPKLTHLLTIVLFAESADFKAESIACDNFPKPPTASKMVLSDFSTPACVGSSAVYVCNAGGINKRKVNNTAGSYCWTVVGSFHTKQLCSSSLFPFSISFAF